MSNKPKEEFVRQIGEQIAKILVDDHALTSSLILKLRWSCRHLLLHSWVLSFIAGWWLRLLLLVCMQLAEIPSTSYWTLGETKQMHEVLSGLRSGSDLRSCMCVLPLITKTSSCVHQYIYMKTNAHIEHYPS